ncbi:MAG TPA: S8 family peptidase [Puia sp.]|nr:S8 family peptidase [Puia sp.]
MAGNNAHLFINNIAVTFDFKPKKGFGSDKLPDRNRQQHSDKLLQEFAAAEAALLKARKERQETGTLVKLGSYWEFAGKAGYSLLSKSLEDANKEVRLLNIQVAGDTPDTGIIKAVVYVPEGQEEMFHKKITDYKFRNTQQGKPKNATLVTSIESLGLASVRSLWTDDPSLLPAETAKWCELWLQMGGSKEYMDGIIQEACELLDISLSQQILTFPERIVRLIRANRSQLTELIEICDFIAELRAVKETARFWLTESNTIQSAWVEELLNRTQFHFPNDIGICILDTGINNGHRLIAPVLQDADRHSVEPQWGLNDHDGHGTLMGGIAIYGNLQGLLESQMEPEINHRLSSVKILPPDGENDNTLYGAITIQGISRAEIAAPERKQIYCMAVTTQEKIFRGRPTSYSSAIDQLAFGESEDEKRLIIISAGNLRDNTDFAAYPASNITSSVEDPAQAWNALTIGAVTDKIIITDQGYNGHTPIAELGQLSPYSSTSISWEHRKWPLKPDVVLEGGNILKGPDNNIVGTVDDLAVLSTSKRPINNQFDAFSGTSAASAFGSWMCAKILAVYPSSWPETVRGLIIHSAEWTEALLQQFNIDISRKSHLANLMRICGYGVPDLVRAIENTQSSFTLIAEEGIRPFTLNEDGRVVAKDMHFYKLPWPKELLLGLGETEVKFKITLSYFIEPAPGEVGWKDRYRYQSFGFRFEVNNPTETEDEFKKRINLALREEDDDSTGDSGAERWLIGPKLRNLGSVHSDSWKATAAEISTCNFIAIYPVTGWWKERKPLGRWQEKTRYSLLISLETPRQEIDLYSPIYALIANPVTIVI